MELHKLNSFDSWFDGYISVSSRIVKYFHNSKNFTIPEYEGRDELYEEYITKYDEYIRVLDVIYEESAYDVEPIFIKLKNVLHRLYEEKKKMVSILIVLSYCWRQNSEKKEAHMLF